MADVRDETPAPLLKRLGWMAAIWLASVAVLGTVAFVLRAVLK